MGSAFNFLKYNNIVPIIISLTLVGAGGAFAATNPQAIYSQQQTVVSIDNSYLLHTNLSTYMPQVQITGVTEDSSNYYVAYTLSTIDLQNNAWQPVQKPETMQVSKADLGPYRDLGVYVTGQLTNVVDHELDRLKQTQTDQQPSQEQVVTEYSGLVGKFLNPSTTVLPGYTPVVAATTSQIADASASQSPQNMPSDVSQPQSLPSGGGSSSDQTSSGQPPSQSSGPIVPNSGGLPTLQILGNNPATISLNSTYNDLGAVITGPTTADQGLGIHVFLDGTEVQTISIDTRAASTHTVEYQATNQYGVAKADRTIVVGDPQPASASTSGSDATTTLSASSTPSAQ